MTETEMDALVARLVPEYEATKLKAVIARQDFLIVAASDNVSRRTVADAHERWLELEDHCAAILQRIDTLAETSAA
jgi:hypothetical protein